MSKVNIYWQKDSIEKRTLIEEIDEKILSNQERLSQGTGHRRSSGWRIVNQGYCVNKESTTYNAEAWSTGYFSFEKP